MCVVSRLKKKKLISASQKDPELHPENLRLKNKEEKSFLTVLSTS